MRVWRKSDKNRLRGEEGEEEGGERERESVMKSDICSNNDNNEREVLVAPL